ncbi:hypothetical protein B0T22DRAFT_436642 [Podospora appendiculata]|uniref:Uncharacterized protein n=1 Tax=Podospora appendiculata TaxID=314037 RepID=A0AAE1CGA0_9PEZI|nr:hypothetical protein B0T22DRAFT_436642 [Podospora appendiculata]
MEQESISPKAEKRESQPLEITPFSNSKAHLQRPTSTRTRTNRLKSHPKYPDFATSEWRPFFLAKTTLAALLVLFVVLVAGLGGLYGYSSQHGGLVPVAAKYHQLWKYGPNAEYCAKQLVAWHLLLSESEPIRALELDYFFQINIVALFSSAWARHWVVALAIASTLLLQAASTSRLAS